MLAGRPGHVLQGVFTLEVTIGQVSALLLAALRQGRLIQLPTEVRRHVDELGTESVTERTGLSQELATLLALHDAVNWEAVTTLPPYRAP